MNSESTARDSESLDVKHLAIAIVAAGRACDVRRHSAAALRAALEDRCTPAGSAAAHFLAAFGLAAFWYGHGRSLVKVGP